MTKGTTLTEVSKESKALATTAVSGLYAEDAGTGFENVRRGDFALPFIKILQGLSPELERGNAKFISGAQAGDIVHSITNEVVSGEKGIAIIAATFDKKWIEWRPRKSGGGLVGIRDTVREAEARKLPDIGNPDVDTTVDETAQHYVLAQFSDGFMPAVLAWSRTKLKASRAWLGLQMQQTTKMYGIEGTVKVLPPAALIYKLTTKVEKKNNNTYFVPVVEVLTLNQDAELYLSAKAFKATVDSGEAKVDYEEAITSETSTTSSGGPDDVEPQY